MNIPDYQLNLYLGQTCPCFEAASKWKRCDVGPVEAYVGDETYVVAILSTPFKTVEELHINAAKARTSTLKYLQSEGFLGENYVYIAIQELDLQNLPEGLQ